MAMPMLAGGLLGKLLDRSSNKKNPPIGHSEMGAWDRTGRYGAGTSLLAGGKNPLAF